MKKTCVSLLMIAALIGTLAGCGSVEKEPTDLKVADGSDNGSVSQLEEIRAARDAITLETCELSGDHLTASGAFSPPADFDSDIHLTVRWDVVGGPNVQSTVTLEADTDQEDSDWSAEATLEGEIKATEVTCSTGITVEVE
ncbi:putative small lipoprotein YifL [Microbacterium natoriense]|uniref:Small lipoprotein YifL n=1 Tax=Microbacterium natoriense TaxID=284570 RepID=A0AAW8EUZ0_9MICO|nr:hypothetical protein [Microbacterium natoriense]MDQ0647265.1 putative small lipoprotein YifL [Microbacterium natoriense]